jgi:hypothetical protein
VPVPHLSLLQLNNLVSLMRATFPTHLTLDPDTVRRFHNGATYANRRTLEGKRQNDLNAISRLSAEHMHNLTPSMSYANRPFM